MTEFFQQLQTEHREWQRKNFPEEADGTLSYRMLLGMMEELGEIEEALDLPQNRHWGELLDLQDAVGDMMIFSAGYCNDRGYCLQTLMDQARNRLSVPVIYRTLQSMPQHKLLLQLTRTLSRLARAHLKGEEGIRGSADEHDMRSRESLIELYMLLAHLVNTYSRTVRLEGVVKETWEQVKKRNWSKIRRTENSTTGLFGD